MTRIKIISNPYQKTIVFQHWNEVAGCWNPIDQANSPNSMLLREDLIKGFFPFRVKEIVDIIINDYRSDAGKIEIEFEGTDDEYHELVLLCTEDNYPEEVSLTRSARTLENAKDILPSVIGVFRSVENLVESVESLTSESDFNREKIAKELSKFSDASNDIIPICVIGNYSSGKSTFINALVGYELLPSSDEPTTAKVYKISQPKAAKEDQATVQFTYDGRFVSFCFGADFHKFFTDPADNPLSEQLSTLLEELHGERIPIKLHRILDAINTHANRINADIISDLIEIEAPFDEDGLWSKIGKRFVIIDTPGSNSASNVKHYEVLKKAMEGLTNGLPIFVSEFDSLDSTDNDKLYQDINNMQELDNRFTMIIVNKADIAALKKTGHTEEDRDRILHLAIPKKLYAGGLYFVSSIMGLGAKNDEDFIDDHNAEIFEDQRNKYANPKSRFYKQLYRYNIMPEQIRRRYDACSMAHENLIYANSGLYSIEQAINTFATTYSSYNKCQQSIQFLGNVIRIVSEAIDDSKYKREEIKAKISGILAEHEQMLIDQLEQESAHQFAQYTVRYPKYMEGYLAAASKQFTSDELREQEAELLRINAEEKDVEGRRSNVKKSAKVLGDRLAANVTNALRAPSLASIRRIGTDVAEGVKSVADHVGELNKAKTDATIEATDELIASIKANFSDHITHAQTLLESESRAYWARKVEVLKKIQSQIIMASTELVDQKRSELAEIIIQYQEPVFENKVETIFDKADFLHRIFGDSNRVDIEKLTHRYNSEMQNQIQECYAFCRASHAESFDAWMNNLLLLIRENIKQLSPQLQKYVEDIREETAKIADLAFRRTKLDEYAAQINRLMDWSES